MSKALVVKNKKSGDPFWRVVLLVSALSGFTHRDGFAEGVNDFWLALNGECPTATAGDTK
jgi:hypothetical protein